MNRRLGRVIIMLAIPAASACSMLLDFDLAGAPTPAPSTNDGSVTNDAPVTPPNADSSSTPSDAGDASPPPPFPPLQCADVTLSICDGFEAALPDQFFKLVTKGSTGVVESSTAVIGAGTRSLRVSNQAADAVFAGAESLAINGNNHAVTLSLVMQLEYATGGGFQGSRTVLTISPYGLLSQSPTLERMWLAIESTGPVAFIRKNDATLARIDVPALTPNVWHRLDLEMRFHPQNGRLRVLVDGVMVAPEVTDAPTASNGFASATWSLALSASAQAAASAVTVTFDNVTGSAK